MDNVIDVEEYLGYKDFDVMEYFRKHDPEMYQKLTELDQK